MSRYFPNRLLLSLIPVFAFPKASISGFTRRIFSSKFLFGALPALTNCFSCNRKRETKSRKSETRKQNVTHCFPKFSKTIDAAIHRFFSSKITNRYKHVRDVLWYASYVMMDDNDVSLTSRFVHSVFPAPLSPQTQTHWLVPMHSISLPENERSNTEERRMANKRYWPVSGVRDRKDVRRVVTLRSVPIQFCMLWETRLRSQFRSFVRQQHLLLPSRYKCATSWKDWRQSEYHRCMCRSDHWKEDMYLLLDSRMQEKQDSQERVSSHLPHESFWQHLND